MKIDNKKVDMFYDLVDEACMTYYHDIKRASVKEINPSK